MTGSTCIAKMNRVWNLIEPCLLPVQGSRSLNDADLHDLRIEGLSDHSALELDFDI